MRLIDEQGTNLGVVSSEIAVHAIALIGKSVAECTLPQGKLPDKAIRHTPHYSVYDCYNMHKVCTILTVVTDYTFKCMYGCLYAYITVQYNGRAILCNVIGLLCMLSVGLLFTTHQQPPV